ncbi:uncharacterized protein LOC107264057 [Cephus cinctus]|uniref:Uncharacterized protein LOC107264057 n=1 Tax=Cephus cinctus TaxID=211228 RepID=A0AAJ7BK14_CEPCN|nr:uncharacterized protein LOC107264057 [Cephus cinctus]
MKKSPLKRSGSGATKVEDLKKPFGFCCDIKNQDHGTIYNARHPPFKSSLADIVLNGGGPDLKFRIQDIGKPLYPIQWGGIYKIKSPATLGDCKRCRGPLKWYLEEEISLAKETVVNERTMKYNTEADKNLKIAMKKVKKRKERKRLGKHKRKTRSKEHKETVQEEEISIKNK